MTDGQVNKNITVENIKQTNKRKENRSESLTSVRNEEEVYVYTFDISISRAYILDQQ
jgi:hypothetical protein